ncbi:hypothetical protein F4805DRAFT_415904 [Annulohypoxylon moriforme]|nr:hypothetical protein F4805DRAFT_415904 [Annulohypoxylon moriforme]
MTLLICPSAYLPISGSIYIYLAPYIFLPSPRRGESKKEGQTSQHEHLFYPANLFHLVLMSLNYYLVKLS